MNVSYLGEPIYRASEFNKTPKNLIPNTKIIKPLSIYDLFDRIQNDKDLKAFTSEVRKGNRLKQEAEGFIAAGEFTYRANDPAHITCMSGLICIDIDSYKPEQIEKALEKGEELPLNAMAEMKYLKGRLEKWPYTFAVHNTFTPGNLSLFVKIPPIYDTYQDMATAIGTELFSKFRVVIDPSCLNPAFPKRISSDPEIFINKKAKEWTKFPKKEPVALKTFNFDLSDDNFHHCIRQIKEKQIDICPDYHDWVQVMLSIADEFGKEGLPAFLTISQQHEELKLNERALTIKYNNACKLTGGKTGKKVSMKTFYWLCKKVGIDIISDRNEILNNTCAKFINAPISTARKVAKTINELEKKNFKIPEKEHEKEHLFNNLHYKFKLDPATFGSTCFSDNLQVAVEKYIKNFNPCRNSLTGEMMMNGMYNDDLETYDGGEIMEDKHINSMIGSCNALFNKIGGLDKVIKNYLHSANIPEIHPIKAFVTQERAKRDKIKTGLIDQLVDCIKINASKEGEKLFKILIKKWLLGLSQYQRDKKCELVLVLCGEGGKYKTKWIQELLPEKLQSHFAQNSFEASGDFNRLKRDKLIILDDEFKAEDPKTDKLIKALTSEKKISHRPLYKDQFVEIERSPIYCATSNPTQVLNDLTGNRRIIPVHVKYIDIDAFQAIDKTDLFLEIDEFSRTCDEENFYMTPEEVKELKVHTEDSMNYDTLYYTVKSLMQPLPKEKSTKGAAYEDVFSELKKYYKGSFRRNDLTQVLKRLEITVDSKQSGAVLKPPYDLTNPRWVYTVHNSRKTIIRAEFFGELNNLNDTWRQKI